jgi:4-amino-4-deoxy-L-arabinose transferase-like glycosyltransferase
LHPSTLAKRVYLLLFAIIIAFYLYGLGKLPLLGPDEPRYAQVAREMFLTGDPDHADARHHTWFEKPALLYWMIAGFVQGLWCE